MSVKDSPGVVSTAAASTVAKPRLGLALLVIATAQLMLVLDNTIMNVALPAIQRALKLPTSDLNWVISAYALAFGGLLLVGGRAGDLFGRRRVFRIGLVVFTIASLLGGLAGTGGLLIGARILQGVGAAIAAPTALSLLATTFAPGPARNKALGVYGAMGGLGSVLGLLLGGALTQYLSWRWVLFINVPIAIAVLSGTSILVEGERARGRVDVPGAIAATVGLGSLAYAVTRAGTNGWSDSVALVFIAVAAVLLLGFFLIERSSSAPMMPGGVLRDRNRSGAYVVMFLIGAGMFATFYFLTLYMQVVKGYPAMETGLAYLPFALGIGAAAGGIGPKLLSRLSARGVIVLGLVLAIAGMVWFSMVTPTSPYPAVVLPAMLLTSVGLGLAFVTITIVGVRGVAPQDTGIASGLVNVSQQIGGALGLAVLASIASTVTRATMATSPLPDALTHGYSVGFLIGGACYLAALVVGGLFINARVSEH